MYLVYNPDGIVLVCRYYVTCLNLLFSNRPSGADLYLEAKVVGHPPAEDGGYRLIHAIDYRINVKRPSNIPVVLVHY